MTALPDVDARVAASSTPGDAMSAATSFAEPPSSRMLPIGTRLRDYEITRLIGEGAFAIVYLAFDHSLQRKVAIKEYMPFALACRAASGAVTVASERQRETFSAGLKGFVSGARLLARFDHPSLVKVYRFWEENGTAYMGMPYYEGPTLKSALGDLGHVPSEAEIRAWLRPLLNAVTVMHEAGFHHHHIGPDNILVTPTGPVLLDFAAARRVVEGETRTPAPSLKPGFAAIEQYGEASPMTQGAWTDLYALAAVVYAAITASPPMPAPERLAHDGMLPLRAAAAGLYGDRFLQAIDAALALQPEARPRDHAQFRALMGDIDAPNEAVALSALRDLMLEPFVVDRARSVEITVPDLRTDPTPEPAVSRWPGAPSIRGDSQQLAGSEVDALERRSKVRPPTRDKVQDPVAASGVELRTSSPGRPRWLAFGGALVALGALVWGVMSGTRVDPSVVTTPPTERHAGTPAPALTPAPATAFSPALTSTPTPTLVPALPPAPDPARSNDPAPAVVSVPTVTAATPSAVTVAPMASTATPVPTQTPAAPTAVTGAVPTRTVPAPPAAIEPAPLPRNAAADPVARDLPLSAAARKARCVEILQKVSLEPMTPADSTFYKKECQ